MRVRFCASVPFMFATPAKSLKANTLWRAVIGTGIGFLFGVVLFSMVGVDPVVLWILMPLVVFGSAYVPEIASFTAAQAAFTMMVLIFFNLVVPTGWQVGLIRVQDVVAGALVGVTVSVFLWPRGATASVTRAIDSARSIFTRYLRVAVLRITRGAFEERTDKLATLAERAVRVRSAKIAVEHAAATKRTSVGYS